MEAIMGLGTSCRDFILSILPSNDKPGYQPNYFYHRAQGREQYWTFDTVVRVLDVMVTDRVAEVVDGRYRKPLPGIKPINRQKALPQRIKAAKPKPPKKLKPTENSSQLPLFKK